MGVSNGAVEGHTAHQVGMSVHGYLGLNGRTRTMTAFRWLADIRVRFLLSSHGKIQPVTLPNGANPDHTTFCSWTGRPWAMRA